ncbi:hypothetical protein Taro_036697 [Colocasia esculenta]|uniref:Receptor-like serine/threonine-protein kinase n=1 Tax=Colocasia esculenta TaxID=4460 RepID=A0A843WE42_COLES|nr:hypothetical protein [Colocasia esculenta]
MVPLGSTLTGLAISVLAIFASSISAVTSRVPLGSKLIVEGGGCWVSPGGDFALGFFNISDQPDRYGVGIRFNSAKFPAGDRTVVWVAGGGVSVGGRYSYLHLTEAGELVIFDASIGVTAWSSNTSHGTVASAELLDDGNLVLLDKDQGVVWQSFETPSDTLLPGQRLAPLKTLRAAGRDSVSSYYTLSMGAEGQLRLSWETNVSYWKTEAPSAFTALFTGDGALKLLDRRMTAVWSSFGVDHGDPRVVFRFLRLDVDGNLRMYSWAEESRSWRTVWQAVQNQCDVFASCGLHGVCFLNSSGTAACKCPFGSTPGPVASCLAPYKQNCRSGATMAVLKHTFLYGVYPPEDASLQMASESCSRSCLQDPSCTSATATNDGEGRCLMKRTSFITGYEDPSLASVSFVKVCLDPIAAALPTSFSTNGQPSPSSAASRSSRLLCTPCLVGAAAGTFLTLCLMQLAFGLFFVRRRKAKNASKASIRLSANPVGVVSLAPLEIKNLTSNFEHRIGSNTYRGVLPDDKVVVIRDLKGSRECVDAVEDKHFRRWAAVLGGIHHKNLLRLEAYSCKSEQRFLVYEFAKNGSVERWLGEPKLSRRLTWAKRMEICTGVARALAYLHSECREFVSHGNLNWRNVVLDETLEAKVTKYGLWKLRGGTAGGATAAEDVSRFGEMVLALVSGQQASVEVCRSAYREWAEGHVGRMVDTNMGEKVDFEEVERAIRVAFWCIQEDERLRPSMGEVAKVLEGTLPVDLPPPPSPSLRQLGNSDP